MHPIQKSYLLAVAAATLLLTIAPGAGLAQETAPLVLKPDNTIILNAGGDAVRLQFYLIKTMVGDKESAAYALDQKPDRAASPWFPVIQETMTLPLPEGRNIIALGGTRFATAEDKAAATGNRGILRRQDKVVVVLGAQSVPRFLDKVAGIRLYAPGELWLTRPKDGQITIPAELNLRYDSLLSWQSAAGGYRLEADKAAGNPLSIAEWEVMNGPAYLPLWAPHNVSNLFSPDRYGKTHPEIYEMRNGQRVIPDPKSHHWHPCFSARALPDLAMEAVREQMRRNPKTEWVSLFLMDIGMDCQCPDCQDSVRRYGDYSQLYHGFVIRVAEQCKKEFPNLTLTATPNYSSVRRPPQDGLRYPGNVALKFLLKSYSFGTPGAVERLKAAIREYSNLGARWFAHDWVFAGPCPRENMRQYAAFLQWAAQNGMVGTRIEWSNGEYWYLDGPKYWLMTQIYRDPYQDVALLTRQYCDDMYGPASEVMYRLFQHFADKFLYASNYIVINDLPRQEPALYSAEDLAYERALIEKAAAMTKEDPRIQKRLEAVLRHFASHELFAKACFTPRKLDFEFKGEGLNRAALAWFANEAEDNIGRAVDFYENKRTVPPDVKELEIRLGLEPSLIANYTAPKARIIKDVRTLGMKASDLAAIRNARDVAQYVADCKRILAENLPPKRLDNRVKEFEWMLEQVLWVPSTRTMPAIDGDLTDDAWQQAAVLTEFRRADSLAESPHATTGRIMRVGDRLVIGLSCTQSGEIWAKTAKDVTAGTLIWRESGVEVFFGLTEQKEPKTPYAQWIINAFGAYRGFAQAADLRDAEVAVRLDRQKGTYVVEAALPLKTAKYDYSKEKVLSFNITRMVFNSDSYFPTAFLGWHPIFHTGGAYYSRGLIFME